MQYQILHRIVPTINYLYKIKLKDSPLCNFCKLNIETIEDLFTECFEVKDIWYKIKELFLTKTIFLLFLIKVAHFWQL